MKTYNYMQTVAGCPEKFERVEISYDSLAWTTQGYGMGPAWCDCLRINSHMYAVVRRGTNIGDIGGIVLVSEKKPKEKNYEFATNAEEAAMTALLGKNVTITAAR